MNIISYGGGTNSTAMIIELYNRKIPIDLIMFSDTGDFWGKRKFGEKPHTYNYVEMFSKWCVDHGLPEITIVRKAGNGETLEEELTRKKTLPPVAFGFKTCSQKYKIQPQLKYANNLKEAKEIWKAGNKITRCIGYDADEPQRADAEIPEDQAKKYINYYPLIEWDIGRDDCIEIIKNAGLCQPGKSSCYYCPNAHVSEIKQLKALYPELAQRAVNLEDNARENMTTVKGLGRIFAWGNVMKTPDMFEDDYFHTPDQQCDCYDG